MMRILKRSRRDLMKRLIRDGEECRSGKNCVGGKMKRIDRSENWCRLMWMLYFCLRM